jgi:hypothetical protein
MQQSRICGERRGALAIQRLQPPVSPTEVLHINHYPLRQLVEFARISTGSIIAIVRAHAVEGWGGFALQCDGGVLGAHR